MTLDVRHRNTCTTSAVLITVRRCCEQHARDVALRSAAVSHEDMCRRGVTLLDRCDALQGV